MSPRSSRRIEDVDLVDVLGEEQRGLPGRVGASHHDRVLADACPRLELGRGVVDAATLELGDAGDLQAPVPDAAGDDDGPGGDIVVVIEPDRESVRAARQPGHRSRRDQPRPELDGLQQRRPGQLAAGDPAWKAEVVLDPRRRAGLPAEGDVLDDDDVKSLGGSIDGSRQARWTGADDHQVATRLVGQPAEVETDGGGQLTVRRFRQEASSPGHHGRPLLGQRTRGGDLGPGGCVRAQHRPIGDVIALGELPKPVQVGVVVAGEHQAALAPAGEHAPARIEGREQHVAEFAEVATSRLRSSTRTRKSVLSARATPARKAGCLISMPSSPTKSPASTTTTTRSSLRSSSMTPPARTR